MKAVGQAVLAIVACALGFVVLVYICSTIGDGPTWRDNLQAGFDDAVFLVGLGVVLSVVNGLRSFYRKFFPKPMTAEQRTSAEERARILEAIRVSQLKFEN